LQASGCHKINLGIDPEIDAEQKLAETHPATALFPGDLERIISGSNSEDFIFDTDAFADPLPGLRDRRITFPPVTLKKPPALISPER